MSVRHRPPYTLDRPHPDHQPTVDRRVIGKTRVAPQRPLYGTTLWCSCRERLGWGPGGNMIANEAPSKGGRRKAAEAYWRHLQDALEDDR